MIGWLVLGALALYGASQRKSAAAGQPSTAPVLGPVQLQAQAQSALSKPTSEISPETPVLDDRSFALAFKLPLPPGMQRIAEGGVSAASTSPGAGRGFSGGGGGASSGTGGGKGGFL